MNPHQPPPVSFTAFYSTPWRNLNLILQMTKREVIGRYRGSIGGLLWSFFNPLLMLVIYTFVFSVVFKARWGEASSDSKTDFAIILFVGLIVHALFAECVNRAPTLILTNANYVKKVIFPLEILAWVALGSALFHGGMSVLVLLLAELIVMGHLPWTAALLPLIALPLCLFTLGFTWFVAALGVYIRDIGQITVMFTTALMFLSPIFYPMSAMPAEFQAWLKLNPLALIIEDARNALIFGRAPEMGQWIGLLLASLLVAWAGFAWFQKSRKGFADVL